MYITYKSGNPQRKRPIPILVTIVIAIVIVIVFVHFQNCLNISFYNPLFEFDFMSGLLGQHTKVEKETERAREIMNHFQKIISTLSAWKPATSISQPNIHINSFIVYSSICKWINVYYVNVINKFVQLFFASVKKFVYKKISEFLFHLAGSPSPCVCLLCLAWLQFRFSVWRSKSRRQSTLKGGGRGKNTADLDRRMWRILKSNSMRWVTLQKSRISYG